MRSKKIDNARIPWPVYEKGQERCHKEKYRSFGRYLLGLVLRDVLMPSPHFMVQAIANADPGDQDVMLDVLLKANTVQLREIAETILTTCRGIRVNTDGRD